MGHPSLENAQVQTVNGQTRVPEHSGPTGTRESFGTSPGLVPSITCLPEFQNSSGERSGTLQPVHTTYSPGTRFWGVAASARRPRRCRPAVLPDSNSPVTLPQVKRAGEDEFEGLSGDLLVRFPDVHLNGG